ncbi:hypothetical protein G9A89_019149 [Geosiphon pyriformis]|nr:hypothetical protein G9A89_019149 [Geosiphon pyriformis]
MTNVSELEVEVQVNNEIPVLCKLESDAKLCKVRENFNKNNNILMGEEMFFMKGSARVQKKDEGGKDVQEIIKESTLKITGSRAPDWDFIINSLKFEYGINFLKEGACRATNKAFKFKKIPSKPLAQPEILEETVTCKNQSDKFVMKNFLNEVNIEASLPWSSTSLGLGVSIDSKKEVHQTVAKSETFSISKRIHSFIDMSEDEVEPTPEFVSAVEKAFIGENKKKNLEDVLKDFGPYWCKRIALGGKLITEEKKEQKVEGQNKGKETLLKGSMKVGGSNIGAESGPSKTTTNSNSSSEESLRYWMYGGEERNYQESGMKGWLNSIYEPKNWSAVQYDNVHCIFELLPEETHNRIREAFEKRIESSRVESIEFKMDLSVANYIHELPKDVKISKDHQVFVTVMNEKLSDSDFAPRVHYHDENSRPVIQLYRLGKLEKGRKYKKFSLKLGWIVLGTSNMVDLINSNQSTLFIKSAEETITNNRAEILYIPDPNDSLIVTCVSRSKDNQNNPRDCSVVTGTHFVYNNKKMEACTFSNQVADVSKMPMNVSVNYSTIRRNGNGKSDSQFGHTEISKGVLGKLIPNRLIPNALRFEVSFDEYKNLLKKPVMFQPIFISLIFMDCVCGDNCAPGFFSINPKSAIYRSLKKCSLSSGKIAYFCPSTNSQLESES